MFSLCYVGCFQVLQGFSRVQKITASLTCLFWVHGCLSYDGLDLSTQHRAQVVPAPAKRSSYDGWALFGVLILSFYQIFFICVKLFHLLNHWMRWSGLHPPMPLRFSSGSQQAAGRTVLQAVTGCGFSLFGFLSVTSMLPPF